jgi:hypothetical protein
LLAQKTLSVITYSREELLDIRETSTYQLNLLTYYQEYDFPEADPLSEPTRALELIPEVDPKQLRCSRGRQSGLLIRNWRRAHHPPLPSILLTNVQPLDNKVDEIRAMVAFQRDIRNFNILCFIETWLCPDMLSESVPGFFVLFTDRN